MSFGMTALRLISLPVHSALEMLLGFVVMATPIALGLSPAAAISGVVIGTLVVGLSLSSTGPEVAGRRTLAVATHHAFDYGLAMGLTGAALVLGLAGDRAAAVVFALTALGQFALNLTTRYTRR
jgi:hypothetical protein